MTLPVVFHPFGLDLPAHLVFESLAYLLGFRLLLFLRRRSPDASLPFEQTAWLLVGAVFGALVGSKLLAWLEHPEHYWSLRHNYAAWLGGKTIVGGLLGGWAGVEFAKWSQRIRTRTGDLYVFPLLVGIAVGRVGCFLTGLPDQTYGTETALPWGVDFGDGVHRHPTQLYEIVWAIVLAAALLFITRRSPVGATLASPADRCSQQPPPVDAPDDSFSAAAGDASVAPTRPLAPGDLFRLFLAGYLLFRFAVEWIKPSPKGYGGVSAIQIASVIGVAVCVYQLALAKRAALPSPSVSSALG